MRGNFPQEDTARRRIQRQQRKVFSPLPKSLSEMNIPEEWQRTSTGDQFQLLDVTFEEGSRIIVFCTDSCLKYLCSRYGDGTFSIAPQHIYQLYTIHSIVMGQLVPLMYCLLSKKTQGYLS